MQPSVAHLAFGLHAVSPVPRMLISGLMPQKGHASNRSAMAWASTLVSRATGIAPRYLLRKVTAQIREHFRIRLTHLVGRLCNGRLKVSPKVVHEGTLVKQLVAFWR